MVENGHCVRWACRLDGPEVSVGAHARRWNAGMVVGNKAIECTRECQRQRLLHGQPRSVKERSAATEEFLGECPEQGERQEPHGFTSLSLERYHTASPVAGRYHAVATKSRNHCCRIRDKHGTEDAIEYASSDVLVGARRGN